MEVRAAGEAVDLLTEEGWRWRDSIATPHRNMVSLYEEINYMDQIENVFFLILPFIIYALYIIVPVAIIWAVVVFVRRKKRGDQK